MKAEPDMAGPIALPIAEIETANPFKVPKMRKLTAELVSKITQQGNAKITANDLTIRMAKIVICCQAGDSMRAV